ncbi:hypothetical protein GCM10022255_041330 [Dactylosporangium darangshiense]|uniref:Uncharacterized protein n=1 Tax=Dactylosporangium darangshiense TaxID=579108 RepID=A0ABP8D9X8_9ACTN
MNGESSSVAATGVVVTDMILSYCRLPVTTDVAAVMVRRVLATAGVAANVPGVGMTHTGPRTPPGADLYASGARIFLGHPEGRAGRLGYAEYDANTGYFSCRTCPFEQAGAELTKPCTAPACRGLMVFDLRAALVCRSNPAHRQAARTMR